MTPEFAYSELLPADTSAVPMTRLDIDGVRTVRADIDGVPTEFLSVEPRVFTELARRAYEEIAHFLRPAHLRGLERILEDPEASANDRYVAEDLLRNAVISAGTPLPMCQDTGTAIITGKRGPRVLTDGRDAEHLARGVHAAYTELSLRASQLAPLSTWDEVNTGTNLPAQIDIELSPREGIELLFMAKGGGSANKSFLFQQTKAVLDPVRLMEFLTEKIASLGTAACPPYHLAVVIGGTSAEHALKTAKLASAHALDALPTRGDGTTGHGIRDPELEAEILRMTQGLGFGAQFGGKYFCHDVRAIRLPRHNGSLPIALAVSCSADRQALARITAEGVFLEALEHDPAQFLPAASGAASADCSATGAAADDSTAPTVDLDRPLPQVLKQLSTFAVGDRVALSGTMIVARDLAHARLRERLESGAGLPAYFADHPIYYAGPARTPEGFATGSFGPTTAARMDPYLEQFQAAGASLITVAKGNRSPAAAQSCRRHGGFYLGSVGGPAARLAAECIEAVEVLDYPELGMEAVWKIRVRDFPAFIIIDDKGNDFFARTPLSTRLTLGPTRLNPTAAAD